MVKEDLSQVAVGKDMRSSKSLSTMMLLGHRLFDGTPLTYNIYWRNVLRRIRVITS